MEADAIAATMHATDGWFMEYERAAPVLNGHIFAVFGLYSYGDRERVREGIETVRTHLHEFATDRRALYALGEPESISRPYWRVYIDQMAVLHEMTAEPCFDAASRWFARLP